MRRHRGPLRHRMKTETGKLARDLLHDCDRCARYHSSRAAFLDKHHRLVTYAAMLSASAAIATLLAKNELVAGFIMVLPIATGLFNVIWNLPERAREHKKMERQLREYEGAIRANPLNLECLHDLETRIVTRYSATSDVYNALNAECYNAATVAVQNPPKKLLKLRLYHRWLRNFVRFKAEVFRLEPAPMR